MVLSDENLLISKFTSSNNESYDKNYPELGRYEESIESSSSQFNLFTELRVIINLHGAQNWKRPHFVGYGN